PEIPLGVFDEPAESQGEQPFFNEPGQEGDAEFLSGEPGADIVEPKERKGRKVLMAASGLIGIMALGGALAFAYKIGGDSDIASTGKPPLIQADNRPVKMAPAKPGGKQFPHKNKKIYERLQGEKSQVAERLVPRQESVAVAATAALGTAQTAEANTVKSAPPAPVAAAPAGAPRKVKTLTVRPDGTIEPATPRQKVVKAPAPVIKAPAPENSGAGIAMSFPQAASTPPAAPAPAPAPPVKTAAPALPKPLDVTPPPAPAKPAPLQTAALPREPASAPPPVQKPKAPAPQRTAARPAPAPAPASAPAASSREYVVQVAARKSQTDALAAFADLQQKYPKLLSGYRPIIKKADLGSKGVWYRLNVGPVKNKKLASSLCSSLKGAGMRSCIIRAQ
ncbi:MAG: SPOR domain-containing protein, partial [Alphaproteobacteria bacterium]